MLINPLKSENVKENKEGQTVTKREAVNEIISFLINNYIL